MPRLDHQFVMEATGAALQGRPPQGGFAGVSTDSRRVRPGQLFVALKGPNFDGHRFVSDALAKGAVGALVEQGFSQETGGDACLLVVPDTLRALGDLAGAWRRQQKTLVCGLTGSNGKTTTKEMLAAILGRRHRVHKNPGNYNNLIGLPLTLLELTPEHGACVVEMGMNAPGEIARLTEIASPQVGLITNVGPAHIGPLGSLEAVARAKTELFRGLEGGATAVVNLDDPLLAPWREWLSCRVVTFGRREGAELRARDLAALGGRQAFTLELPGGEAVRPRLAVPGEHNVMNALAAAAAAWTLGLGAEEIKAGLEEFAPLPGRLSVVKGATGPWLLDDTYNANPTSVRAGLQALEVIAAGRRMGLILGDMLELGAHSAELHRQTGRDAAQAGCRVVLALGEFAPQVAEGARQGGVDPALALAFSERRELIHKAREIFGPNDVVLVKGSRGMAMEEVVQAVKGPEGDWY